MTIKEIKEKFPKSYEKLADWMTKAVFGEMGRFMQELAEKVDFPPLEEEGIAAAITLYPRRLFSFFDNNGIYLNIIREDISYKAVIEDWRSGEQSTREKAEEQGFTEAFSILEKRL